MVELVHTPAMSPGNIAPRIARRKRRQLPLLWVATFGVMALLLTIVAVFSWQAYRAIQNALMSASDDTTNYIREMIIEKARRILLPEQIDEPDIAAVIAIQPRGA